jgi:hypothetical protein
MPRYALHLLRGPAPHTWTSRSAFRVHAAQVPLRPCESTHSRAGSFATASGGALCRAAVSGVDAHRREVGRGWRCRSWRLITVDTARLLQGDAELAHVRDWAAAFTMRRGTMPLGRPREAPPRTAGRVGPPRDLRVESARPVPRHAQRARALGSFPTSNGRHYDKGTADKHALDMLRHPGRATLPLAAPLTAELPRPATPGGRDPPPRTPGSHRHRREPTVDRRASAQQGRTSAHATATSRRCGGHCKDR